MRKSETILRSILMTVGAVTLALILFVLILAGVVKLGALIANPPLRSGTVTGFSFDDGHTWYSDWRLGPYTLRVAHGDGREHCYVHVEQDGRRDVWEIDEASCRLLAVGQTVTRGQLR